MNLAKGWENSLGDLRKTNNPQFEIQEIWEIFNLILLYKKHKVLKKKLPKALFNFQKKFFLIDRAHIILPFIYK